MGEDHQILAVFLHRRHLVAGHHNVFVFSDQLADHAFENIGVDRVKAAERLIEEDQLRVVDQGGNQLDFLQMCIRDSSTVPRPPPRRRA